jgi:hypothetical protein
MAGVVPRLLAVAVAAALAAGCDLVCFTVYDSCRWPPDAGELSSGGRDAGSRADAAPDAGFGSCVTAVCREPCAGLTDPSVLCELPACYDCQHVFCGRLYSCAWDGGQADGG